MKVVESPTSVTAAFNRAKVENLEGGTLNNINKCLNLLTLLQTRKFDSIRTSFVGRWVNCQWLELSLRYIQPVTSMPSFIRRNAIPVVKLFGFNRIKNYQGLNHYRNIKLLC
jgi:hypothetical protein